jgi:hypothetical protein
MYDFQVSERNYSSTGLKSEPKEICSSGKTAYTESIEERLKSQPPHLGLLSV